MKIITEEDATQLTGRVDACKDRLLKKQIAERIAKREADKYGGTALLCVYEIQGKTNRKVKRYLPLVQYMENK
jgi:hypothetical protein|tara:strand:+ start:2101 stop:2319 length:219 start_codon:yes stop_codon:yes gene_type:complete